MERDANWPVGNFVALANCVSVDIQICRVWAYIVRVDQPEVWEEIPVIPVLDVRQIPEKKLLVFSDFIRLAGYGIDGLAWLSPRVCWDGLKIDRVTHDTIEGTGYDPAFSVKPEFRFIVDLKTGRSLLPAPVSIDAFSGTVRLKT